jgi:hypothetical protein
MVDQMFRLTERVTKADKWIVDQVPKCAIHGREIDQIKSDILTLQKSQTTETNQITYFKGTWRGVVLVIAIACGAVTLGYQISAVMSRLQQQPPAYYQPQIPQQVQRHP